jgi:outer membrane protein TolC
MSPAVSRLARLLLCLGSAAVIAACTPVGPDFVKPETDIPPEWSQGTEAGLTATPHELVQWWRIFDDPVLNELVEMALLNNNTLEIAGLRVLEARAQLGIATGLQFPQVQVAAGDASYISPPASSGATSNYWQFGLGASLLTAAVVDVYTIIRATEEQLRISHENVTIQERSYEIAGVLFKNGADSELDMQQAHTLLLSTRATVPGLEIALTQARNALSTLLNQTPGSVNATLAQSSGIPVIPDSIAVGFPADMLRRRPDVRQAEYQAMSLNALVGLAQADLYPSFSLTGSIGVSSNTIGDSDFGDLFSSDALAWSIGPSFVWPFLNYGRIKNNVRVQDARLQQALVNYRETVLQAAREAEDAMAGYIGTKKQHDILAETVISAIRSNELSTLRYKEGFSDYERVLNAQQALFNQQQRYITNQGDIVRNLIALYKALGGGWENRDGLPYIDPKTLEIMQDRTDWGDLIEAGYPEQDDDGTFRKADW